MIEKRFQFDGVDIEDNFEIVDNESNMECQKCSAIPYFWVNSNGEKICPNCKIRESDVE